MFTKFLHLSQRTYTFKLCKYLLQLIQMYTVFPFWKMLININIKFLEGSGLTKFLFFWLCNLRHFLKYIPVFISGIIFLEELSMCLQE